MLVSLGHMQILCEVRSSNERYILDTNYAFSCTDVEQVQITMCLNHDTMSGHMQSLSEEETSNVFFNEKTKTAQIMYISSQ